MLQYNDKPMNQWKQYGAGTFVTTNMQQSFPKEDYYQEPAVLIHSE